MKKLIKIFIISTFLFLIIPENMYSQGPPPWAPAHGYRAKTRHIYFPDQNVYFDLHKRIYLSRKNGIWISVSKPPKVFVGVNLNVAPKVELDFTGDKPFTQNSLHVVKYKKAKKAKIHKVKVFEIHDNDSHHHGKGHGKGHGRH